jgi:YNFM family putative membrane transporter
MDAVSLPQFNTRSRGPARFDATIAAVALAGMCTFLDVYPTQALLPYLRQVFHASEVEVSLTVSATTLGVALAAPIVGLIAEAVGRKRVIVPSLFGLALLTTMAASSTSLRALVAWRFAQGLVIPGIVTVMMAYIGEEWPADRVGFTMAAYVSGTVLGGFLGRFIAGLVTTHGNWRWSFVVLGILTLGGATAVWLWLPRSSKFVRSPSPGATIRDGLRHLRNPRLLATFGMGFSMLFALVGTFTYANFYLAAAPFGLNSAQLGSVFFVYLLGLIVTPLSGRYMDTHGFRKTIALAFALSVAGLALTLKVSLPVVIAGLALFSSGVFVLQAAATAHLGMAAGRARSSAAGLYVTFYYIGGSAGAAVPAWFWVHGGWPATAAVLCFAAFATVALGFAGSGPATQ